MRKTNLNFDMVILFPIIMGLGIWTYFTLPFEPSKWITVAIVETLLLLSYIFRLYPSILRLIFLLFIFVFGFCNIQIKTAYLSEQLPTIKEQKVYLRGEVISHDTNYNGKPRIILGNMERLSGIKIKGKYRLTLLHSNYLPKTSECIELVAEVAPLMKANSVGGYQPDRNLFFEGLNGSGYVLSQVFPIDCGTPNSFWHGKIDKIRRHLTSQIENILPKNQASIAAAIISGNRELMSKEQADNYRNSGLAHFLSISGLHMSMIAGLMFFFIRLIMATIPKIALRYNSKKVAAFFAIIVSTIYLIISGAAVPTQRAYIMVLIILLAVIFERKAISMRNLALAASFILIISPQMLISISFQLSFAAVTAMIAFYESFSTKIHRFLSSPNSGLIIKTIRIITAYLFGVIIADFIASSATLPFVIYHFNKVALYTSLTNLLAGPIIAFIIMPAILLSLLLIPLGLAWLPLKISGFGIGLINNITSWVSSFDGATLWLPSFRPLGMFIIICGGLIICMQKSKLRHLGWLFIFAGALSLFSIKTPDIIAADNGMTIAVKDNNGKLQLLSGGNHWMKQNWADKYNAVFSENDIFDKDFDLSSIDFSKAIGISLYNNKILTVRDYIGRRPWNK
ncbi:MAG: ComEC/Rec2 family competence protein [Alphaproteobacteria bacterium]|nr:ComEC/Rec2 family competence protein [Alphaproteobacteria bacterium]